MRNALLSLDVNKATGPDKFPSRLLKNCAPRICGSQCALFNKSLSLGTLPSAWKLSNVIPIHKGGATKEASNYRPISLLSVESKVLERCVYDKIIDHISNQLHRLQFGFLKGKSTVSQLLQVLHIIGQMLDNRVQCDAVYLDFAKALGKVDHHLLLSKLRKFGISGKLHLWFKGYLSDRYQRMTVLGESSEVLPVQSGVPQGSILGPLLFLVFVNDLPNEATSSSVALFADDTKCYREIRSPNYCVSLQCDLDYICNWCSVWRKQVQMLGPVNHEEQEHCKFYL